MRFEQETPKGRYSITVLFADPNDPDELQVTIGFQPANRTQETFRASFYMIVVGDRYIPYGISHRGEPPCQIRMLAEPIARCAYRFLVHHNIRPKVRVVEI